MLASASSAVADAGGPQPFGHACTLEPYGVRFCPTASLSDRVPSWDGAPLDVDVTLPHTEDGPFPTIVMLHGYNQDKTVFETTNPPGGAPGDFFADHFNNVWFAERGYAVVNLTMRGVANSCGNEQSRASTPACDNVTFELGDQRYDARDVQYLLGRLVDEGIADRHALGVTGISGGSIVASELALLKDRIRLVNGRFAPWVSPGGTPLQIAAAYPEWAVPDTLDTAVPNGRFLDFEPRTATNDRTPWGTSKASFPLGLAVASPVATYSSPTASFNLPRQIAECAAVGPANNPKCASDLEALATYHQAVGMPVASTPAPVLIEEGWEDTLINGASQAIRLADYLSRVAPAAQIFLQLADVGHGITANKPDDIVALDEQATGFFDSYLKSAGSPPPPVTAYTSICPASAPSAGPFTASSWAALHPGAVRFGSSAPQLISSGGDPTIGPRIDPVLAPYLGTHCSTYQATDYPGTAVYTRPVTKTFTMLGLPTLRLHVGTIGSGGQLDARLWDVAPNGQESFVSRGTYALTGGQGTITWQLFGGGYTFPAGDTIRLELLNSDAPFLEPSENPSPVTVSDVTVELPSHDPPDGGEIVSPTFRPLSR